MESGGLFGRYFVVPTPTALTRAWNLAQGQMRHFQCLRRHALKLAFWPAAESDLPDADLDWDWIEGEKRNRIGELRIDERIAGYENIRVIFFKANKPIDDDPKLPTGETMLRIWLLTVFEKKSQGFSPGMIKAWRAARQIILARFYDGDPDA